MTIPLHTITTVAIDPGATTGYAVFQGRALAGIGTINENHVETMARLIGEERRAATILRVVIEEPGVRFHAGAKEFFKGKSLATLNQRVGAYLGVAQIVGADEVIQVLPVTWQRGRNKKTVKAQMQLIYGARLRALGVKRLALDAYDALGLGHHAVNVGLLALLGKATRVQRKPAP